MIIGQVISPRALPARCHMSPQTTELPTAAMLGRERPRAPSASRGCSRLTSLEFSQIVRAIDASTVRASMLLLCERWAETLYTRSVVGPAIFTGVPNRVHRGRAGRQQLASGVRAIEARHSSGLA